MKSDLTKARLYGILDLGYVEVSAISRVAQAMIEGGVDVIQLRAKHKSVEDIVALSSELHSLTASAGIPLIVNDYAHIAEAVPVQGVHMGQGDDSVAVARHKARRDVLVGKSTHSLKQAIDAEREGADYIGFGPIFATPTKPDYPPVGLTHIEDVHELVSIPIFCIGGIKLENIEKVVAAGARRVAIVSGLLKTPDIAQYAREAKQLLNSSLVIRHSSF